MNYYLKTIVFAGLLASFYCDAKITALDKLDAGINTITVTSTSLSSRLSTTEDNVSDNADDIASLQSQITSVKSTLSSLSSSYSSLSSKVSSLNSSGWTTAYYKNVTSTTRTNISIPSSTGLVKVIVDGTVKFVDTNDGNDTNISYTNKGGSFVYIYHTNTSYVQVYVRGSSGFKVGIYFL